MMAALLLPQDAPQPLYAGTLCLVCVRKCKSFGVRRVPCTMPMVLMRSCCGESRSTITHPASQQACCSVSLLALDKLLCYNTIRTRTTTSASSRSPSCRDGHLFAWCHAPSCFLLSLLIDLTLITPLCVLAPCKGKLAFLVVALLPPAALWKALVI